MSKTVTPKDIEPGLWQHCNGPYMPEDEHLVLVGWRDNTENYLSAYRDAKGVWRECETLFLLPDQPHFWMFIPPVPEE